MTARAQQDVNNLKFMRVDIPAELMSYEGAIIYDQHGHITHLHSKDGGWLGLYKMEFSQVGAIQFKKHNDGITWDSKAMERAKP